MMNMKQKYFLILGVIVVLVIVVIIFSGYIEQPEKGVEILSARLLLETNTTIDSIEDAYILLNENSDSLKYRSIELSRQYPHYEYLASLQLYDKFLFSYAKVSEIDYRPELEVYFDGNFSTKDAQGYGIRVPLLLPNATWKYENNTIYIFVRACQHYYTSPDVDCDLWYEAWEKPNYFFYIISKDGRIFAGLEPSLRGNPAFITCETPKCVEVRMKTITKQK